MPANPEAQANPSISFQAPPGRLDSPPSLCSESLWPAASWEPGECPPSETTPTAPPGSSGREQAPRGGRPAAPTNPAAATRLSLLDVPRELRPLLLHSLQVALLLGALLRRQRRRLPQHAQVAVGPAARVGAGLEGPGLARQERVFHAAPVASAGRSAPGRPSAKRTRRDDPYSSPAGEKRCSSASGYFHPVSPGFRRRRRSDHHVRRKREGEPGRT